MSDATGMAIAMSSRLAIRPDVLARNVGDETVLLDLASGTYFGLDPVGARIWSLIGNGRSIEDVRDAMLAEYDVAQDVLERDLVALAAALRAQKLIDIVDG